MAKHRLKLRDLKRILRRFGVDWTDGRGKGSHVLFFKDFDDGRYSYPVPNRDDVLPPYVKGCRKKFRLLPEDGVSDEDFFGNA
jgi:hypothetical protein